MHISKAQYFKVVSAHSARWVNEDRSAIDCVAVFEIAPNIQTPPLPFTASLFDCEDHGRELFVRFVTGQFGKIEPYVKNSPA